MGVPTALIACDRLVKTTGAAAARVHGMPDYPFVIIPYGVVDVSEIELAKKVEIALPQIERALIELTR